jgi:microcin C transport system permease protein
LNAKRFAAFRRNRRAWCAVWALGALAFASLIADGICNSRPLFLRLDGKAFFPAFHFYTEHDLLQNGRFTRVDYHAVVRSERFTANPRNTVWFAPIPYGPNAILSANDFAEYRRLRVTVAPAPRIGRLNLSSDGVISRPMACDTFFPGLADAAGAVLAEHWTLTDAVSAAIRLRFDNRPAPAFEAVLRHTGASGPEAVFSLAAYEPRDTPPATVRLSLRAPDSAAFKPLTRQIAAADVRRAVVDGSLPLLLGRHFGGDTALAESLAPVVASALQSESAEATGVWNGADAHFSCAAPPISWPHRPVRGHWMGVDGSGRDVLARVLFGLRTGLLFGALLVVWAMCIGLVIGALQGYFGGFLDLIGQRLIEIWSALPFLYIMILIGSVLGRSFLLLLICFGLFNWIGISTYMRAEFLRLRGRPFIESARCQGLGPIRIIFRHILPNALTPLITLFPFSLVGAIAALSALDFLGFGLPPLAPSWGELLNQAQAHRGAWWLVVFPSSALFVVMILAVLIGEGLRDAFDPKPKSRME